MNKEFRKELNEEELEPELEGVDEKVVLAIKPHPWFFSRVLLIMVIAVLAILISFYFWGASRVSSYIIFAGFIIVIYTFIRYYFCWGKTHYLLTEERIISHEQTGWFVQSMKEGMLKDVLFISHEKKGFTNHLLNRGTIFIRTSGGVEEEITLRNISNPYDVEKKIAEVKKKYTGRGLKNNQDKLPKRERPIIR